jgi:hypothetical protein
VDTKLGETSIITSIGQSLTGPSFSDRNLLKFMQLKVDNKHYITLSVWASYSTGKQQVNQIGKHTVVPQ